MNKWKLYDDNGEIFCGSRDECEYWGNYILNGIKNEDLRTDRNAELYIQEEDSGNCYDLKGKAI